MGLFEGKVALVTGGSSGIGKGFAEFFVDEGAATAIVARDPQKLERTAEELRTRRADAQVLAVSADVRDEAAVEAMARRVLEAFGRVDILVNSAGLGIWKTVAEMSPDEWRTVIETNLTGTFLVTHAVIGSMLQQGSGHVLNISSVAGKIGFATGSAYCASKWGVIGFTRALAAEVRDKGIRVDVLCPGTVETPFKNSPAASPIRLQVSDVIAAARYLLTLPRQVRVDDIVLYPV
ncbi:MAG: clavaldehyde dehydrogenase [Candidatus Poribacteria bacterium]|nr:MAG: clavaldehyde dehydrogenase [Candidatus Poribacteria bacterium]